MGLELKLSDALLPHSLLGLHGSFLPLPLLDYLQASYVSFFFPFFPPLLYIFSLFSFLSIFPSKLGPCYVPQADHKQSSSRRLSES